MRKLMVLILITFLLTGCTGGGVQETSRSGTLTLAGFPNEPRGYRLEVLAIIGSDSQKAIHTVEYVDQGDEIKLDVMLTSKTTGFMALLYDRQSGRLRYAWQEPVNKSDSDYTIGYWLQNDDISQSTMPKFHVSDYHLIEDYEIAESGLYLDFDTAPYYYIRLTRPAATISKMYLQALHGRIEIEVIQKTEYYQRPLLYHHLEAEADIITLPQLWDIYITIRPGDFIQKTAGTLAFNQHSATLIKGVEEIESTNHDQIVLGFIPQDGTLLYINPITQKIDESFPLPDYKYAKMVYDESNDLVYLFSRSKLGYWSVDQAQMVQEQSFDASFSSNRFALAPELDRLYTVYVSNLEIYELSSGILLSSAPIPFRSDYVLDIRVDEDEEKVFLWCKENNNFYLIRYSVTADQLVVEQILAGVESLIQYSEDLSKIMIYHGGSIKVVSASDFTKFLASSCYLAETPHRLSIDRQYFYGRLASNQALYGNVESGIFVMPTDDYQYFARFKLPIYPSLLTLSNDNSTVVVYDSSNSNLYYIKTYLDHSAATPNNYRDSIDETQAFVADIDTRRTANGF